MPKFAREHVYQVTWTDEVEAPDLETANQMLDKMAETSADDFGGADGEFDEGPTYEIGKPFPGLDKLEISATLLYRLIDYVIAWAQYDGTDHSERSLNNMIAVLEDIRRTSGMNQHVIPVIDNAIKGIKFKMENTSGNIAGLYDPIDGN